MATHNLNLPKLSLTLATPFSSTPPRHLFTPNLPLLPILYELFIFLFSLCAAASITDITFYGRPVKFTSSIKSVLFSFSSLTGTLIIAQLIAALLVFIFWGFYCAGVQQIRTISV